MRKTFVTYEWVKVLVPSTVRAHTAEEAYEMFNNGEGTVDLSRPAEEEQEGFTGEFGIAEGE